MNRTRINTAWALRAVAKAIGAMANRIDPIKLNAPIANCTLVGTSRAFVASKSIATQAIERARSH